MTSLLISACQTMGGQNNPVENTSEVGSKEVENKQLKRQLLELSSKLEVVQQSYNKQRDYAMCSVLQLGAFMCADVASLDLFYSNTINSLYSACDGTNEIGFCGFKHKETREKVYKKVQADKAARDFILD